MCGIAGFIGRGDSETLSSMVQTLKHRGPDDTGIWHKDKVGFAHARLSVIDLSPAGHQPMHSNSGDVTVVFNGEIYNYLELKKELEAKGYTFKSKSDTEVLIELYIEYGTEAFKKLEGMFALALYDRRVDTLLLARDRMGEKPLFFSITDGTLIFASEPKALFQHPNVLREMNSEAVGSYLTFDSVLTPQSIYSDIYKLEPATYALYREGKLTKHSYWQPPQKANESLSFTDAKSKLDALLEKSISRQLVADVPVGIFLSGGLDSSLVAQYAKRSSKVAVHTFSLGFEEESFDESKYARSVAEALGTVHHEKMVSAKEVRDALPLLVKSFDEPLADPAILPNYLLARFAREHVTVALGGDGGDELFAGYPTFTAEKYLHWYRMIPKVLRKKCIEPMIEFLPVSHSYFSLDFKAKQFLRGADASEPYIHQAWLSSFSAKEQAQLLTPEFRANLTANPLKRVDEYLSEMPHADTHMRASYFYLRTYMLDVILSKVDRTSMLTSLEVRAPLLEREVVEFALELPWEFKHNGSTGKYILRELMKDRLPAEIVSRGKHGFGLPVGQWFQGPWEDLLRETLSYERLTSQGIFSPSYVATLIEEHVAGKKNHRKALWSLLMFQLWHDEWVRI